MISLGCSFDPYRTSRHGTELSELVDWELRAITVGPVRAMPPLAATHQSARQRARNPAARSTRKRWGVLVTPPKQTRVALPDTGPLISMALGESLDLLLRVARDVRLALTHVVGFEATHRAHDLPGAQAIRASSPGRWGGIPTSLHRL